MVPETEKGTGYFYVVSSFVLPLGGKLPFGFEPLPTVAAMKCQEYNMGKDFRSGHGNLTD